MSTGHTCSILVGADVRLMSLLSPTPLVMMVEATFTDALAGRNEW